MKKTKIIVPALGMLLLSTAASVTGTVAWFSANATVNVSGMEVTTQVSGNLLIAETNADANYVAADLSQARTGIIEPSSSINGVDFFYTVNRINGAGSAATDSVFAQYDSTATGTSPYVNAFDEYYGVTGAVPYVDYTFYLKATSSAAGQKIIFNKLNLTYNNQSLSSDAINEKAWRTAIFCEPVAKDASGSAAVVDNQKTILALNGATNFTTGNAVKALAETTNYAVRDSVVRQGTAAVLGTLATAGLTQRYKVIVRLWLEGEDNTCNNETFATLTSAYRLSLSAKLVESTDATAVTEIGSVVA